MAISCFGYKVSIHFINQKINIDLAIYFISHQTIESNSFNCRKMTNFNTCYFDIIVFGGRLSNGIWDEDRRYKEE